MKMYKMTKVYYTPLENKNYYLPIRCLCNLNNMINELSIAANAKHVSHTLVKIAIANYLESVGQRLYH